MSSVVVLGAGLQGSGIALELARRGINVNLIDQDERIFNRTSLRNAGKIHLGFVYANDRSKATARKLLAGALTFGPILNSWTSNRFERVRRSKYFHYLTSQDTMLQPEALLEHYAWIQDEYDKQLRQDLTANYLGTRPNFLYRCLTKADTFRLWHRADPVQAVATHEVALNLEDLGSLIRDKVRDSPRINFLGGRLVREVLRTSSGFLVRGDSSNGSWQIAGDQVVNALWAGRRAVDRTMNILDARPHLNRLRYRALVRAPGAKLKSPSATLVLGAFGDVVVYDGGIAYISWYSTTLAGWSLDLTYPKDWNAPCSGVVHMREREAIAQRIILSTSSWYPGLEGAKALLVDAGVINSIGSTDITDPDSLLHRRDATGIESYDGYHSVSTGKLTTAPLYALDAADAIVDCGSASRWCTATSGLDVGLEAPIS